MVQDTLDSDSHLFHFIKYLITRGYTDLSISNLKGFKYSIISKALDASSTTVEKLIHPNLV